MVGRTMTTATRFGARITNVDPSTGLIGVVMKGDAQERRADVYTTPPAFRWPQVGEDWILEQKNGIWYLDSIFPSNTIAVQGVDPGDLVLNAPTGVVHILGSSDGSTDYTLPRYGSITLVAGLATVHTTHITATSLVFLTAQDNNSSGSLRVSARAPDVSFNITSTNAGDHGLVGYQIFG